MVVDIEVVVILAIVNGVVYVIEVARVILILVVIQ